MQFVLNHPVFVVCYRFATRQRAELSHCRAGQLAFWKRASANFSAMGICWVGNRTSLCTQCPKLKCTHTFCLNIIEVPCCLFLNDSCGLPRKIGWCIPNPTAAALQRSQLPGGGVAQLVLSFVSNVLGGSSANERLAIDRAQLNGNVLNQTSQTCFWACALLGQAPLCGAAVTFSLEKDDIVKLVKVCKTARALAARFAGLN